MAVHASINEEQFQKLVKGDTIEVETPEGAFVKIRLTFSVEELYNLILSDMDKEEGSPEPPPNPDQGRTGAIEGG